MSEPMNNNDVEQGRSWQSIALGLLALAGWLWVAVLVLWPVRPIDVYSGTLVESASCGMPVLVATQVSGGDASGACESAADRRVRLAAGAGVLAGPLAAAWLAYRSRTVVAPPAPAPEPVNEPPAYENAFGRW